MVTSMPPINEISIRMRVVESMLLCLLTERWLVSANRYPKPPERNRPRWRESKKIVRKRSAGVPAGACLSAPTRVPCLA